MSTIFAATDPMMPESQPGCSNLSQHSRILAQMLKSEPGCQNPSPNAETIGNYPLRKSLRDAAGAPSPKGDREARPTSRAKPARRARLARRARPAYPPQLPYQMIRRNPYNGHGMISTCCFRELASRLMLSSKSCYAHPAETTPLFLASVQLCASTHTTRQYLCKIPEPQIPRWVKYALGTYKAPQFQRCHREWSLGNQGHTVLVCPIIETKYLQSAECLPTYWHTVLVCSIIESNNLQ